MKLHSIALTVCALFFLVITGCSGIEGYGVLLWSVPEHGLSDGDVVPVFLRSNIGKVYVIGAEETDEKIEIPLWQITEPESKRNATERAEQYAEYKNQYASVKIDGLAIREDAVNTADQIYRLRESEIIKVLYKGEGQPVMRGSTPLEGDWMWVLTSDGTQGWCFSYNLNLYDEREGFQVQIVDVNGEDDEIVQIISQKKWYPEYFASMIADERINLNRFRSDYGFDPGIVSGTVRASNGAINVSYPYVGITRKGTNSYSYDGAPLSMYVRSESNIHIEYTDEIGRRIAYSFISFDAEDASSDYVAKIISEENARRNEQYRKILNLANNFYSSSYGTLSLSANDAGSFTWRGFQRLASQNIIGMPSEEGTVGRGTVSIQYFLSDSLEREFDGVLTLQFENSNDEFNVLYQIESNGIRFELIDNYTIEDEIVTERSSTPIVMFFNAR